MNLEIIINFFLKYKSETSTKTNSVNNTVSENNEKLETEGKRQS